MGFSSTFIGPGVQETPKQNRLLPLLWAFSQNLEVILYCWRHHTGPGGIKPYLVCKPPPWGRSFLGLDGSVHDAVEEILSLVLPSCDNYEPKWWLERQDLLKRWSGRLLSWGHPAAIYSDLRPTQEQGIHSCYGKPSPPPLAGEVIETREDFKTH